MKKRIVAATTALTVLLALMMMFVPFADNAAASNGLESLVRVSNFRIVGNPNLSIAGREADFAVALRIPASASPGLTNAELKELEITLGQSFRYANGDTYLRPFALLSETELTGLRNKDESITIRLAYTGVGSDLAITLAHPSGTETASSSWSWYISQTTPPNEQSPFPDPPPPGTPRLTITGSVPELDAGSRQNIRFTLTNNSTVAASNVTVTLLDGENNLFRPTTIAGNTVTVGTIRLGAANSSNVSIPVDVLGTIPEGFYAVHLRISMTNSEGIATDQDAELQIFIKNPRSGEYAGSPSLSLLSAVINKNTPGTDGLITLTLTIANIGDGAASGARINLSGFKSSEITLNENTVTKQLGNINSGSQATVTYSLRVASSLDSGSYPLSVEVRYREPDGTEASMTDVAHVNIARPIGDTGGNVHLIGISQNTSNPGSSNTIRLTLTVENRGTAAAQDVSLRLDGLSSASFTLSGGAFGDVQLGVIQPGETASATIALFTSESLPNGNYPLAVKTSYTDSTASVQYNSDTEIYIFVNRPENNPEADGASSIPRVIISRHSISVETVNSGSQFELNVTLLNTSTSSNVGNMQVTILDDNGVFIPVEGVSSFYIAELPVGQTTDISIVLMPRQDAETKSHPLTIRLEYEDQGYRPYTVNAALNIPVIMPQRLEITNVSFYDNGTGMAELSFQYINKGMASLNNLNILIEGPMMAIEGAYFHGTLGSGQFDYFEDMIMPFSYGELEGFIVLEFEDSSGAAHEFRHPILTYMSEPYWPDPSFPGDDRWPPVEPGWPGEEGFEESEDDGWLPSWLQGWVLFAVIGGVALFAVIIIIIIVKRKKRKRLELLDDEYEAQISAEMRKNDYDSQIKAE